MPSDYVDVDAKTFQEVIGKLAETIAQKIKREGHKNLSAPGYTYADMFITIRQARFTYDFLFYLNADERRASDYHWKQEYTFTCFPLVRSMIDDLYNLTLFMGDPWLYGPRFRKSGYRKMLNDLTADEKRFGAEQQWSNFIAEKRNKIRLDLRRDGLTETDVLNRKLNPDWLTLGRYLGIKDAPSTANQNFLSTFTYGPWRDYSAISHGAFEGLVQVGPFYNRDGHRHEDRPLLDDKFPLVMSLHIGRAAVILLCIVTEVQLRFRFEGADIANRIKKAWTALQPLFEGQLIYDQRYKELLKSMK